MSSNPFDDNGNIDFDPDLIPEDFHGIDLETAVRLTPATLAFHITRGLWQPANHLLYVASEIARALLEGNAHIIVSMPPRHGKSELLSVNTPIWALDMFPEDPIILATYGADLSKGFSRRVRDTILELGGVDNKPSPAHILAGRPRLRTTVRSDAQLVTGWLTPQGGGMAAVGVGGPITGKGAKILLVDDYIKNTDEAESKTARDSMYDWFTSTAYTRLEPGGSVIILATRWHKDDLIGRLIENQAEFKGLWKVIEIPAIAFNDGTKDLLGRAPGEALWPERYPLSRLMQIKAILGNYFWSAEYQQRPINRADAKFDSNLIEKVRVLPLMQHTRNIRSWDLAGTESKKADWTVGTLISQDGPSKSTMTNTYIRDVKRGKWAQNKLETVLRETALADGFDIPIIIEQEPGSSGKNYANHLKETVLKEFKVTVKAPQSDKWLKAQPFLAAVERGKVKIAVAGWNDDWISEFEDFPSGVWDDQVDSSSQGYNALNLSKNTTVAWGRQASRSDESTDPIVTESGIILPNGISNRVFSGVSFGRR